MKDPRPNASAVANVSVIGFYWGGLPPDAGYLPVDRQIGAGFLGNWFQPAPIVNFAPPNHPMEPHNFTNSEAAFWACFRWDRAAEFAHLSGYQAWHWAHDRGYKQDPDPRYGGFGSEFQVMHGVLPLKFTPGSALAEGLLATGDSYLVEHPNITLGRGLYSDACDGHGQNWLGLQLMKLRDALRVGSARWTAFADAAFAPDSKGEPTAAGIKSWLASVQLAARTLNGALPFVCNSESWRSGLRILKSAV